MSMYTDPGHVHVDDPGKIEGNTVFMYLDVFGQDKDAIQAMKDHYQRGGLGDVKVKKYLAEVLNNFLDPIRAKRAELSKDPQAIMDILHQGTEKTKHVAQETMSQVRNVLCLNY